MPEFPPAPADLHNGSCRVKRTVYAFFYLEDGAAVDIAALLHGDIELLPTRRLYALSLLAGQAFPLAAEQFAVLTNIPAKGWASKEKIMADCGIGDDEIEPLLSVGLVLCDDGRPEHAEFIRRDQQLAEGQWHVYAALYHFMTRWQGIDVFELAKDAVRPGESVTVADETVAEAFIEQFGSPPPHFKPRTCSDEELVDLPIARRDNRFYEVLTRRKTTRLFDTLNPVTADELACVLQYVFGCQGYVQVAEDVVAIKRTSPSGGGLHPTEVYPLLINVEGLEPGLYHYDVPRHALQRLEALTADEAGALAVQFTAGQRYFGSADALFIMTSRFYRNFWKYRKHTRAYAVLLMDAAHLSQTLYLVATELGLGAFVTAAVNTVDIEERLGLDGFEEGCVLVCGLGRPGSPSSMHDQALGRSLNPEFHPYQPRSAES